MFARMKSVLPVLAMAVSGLALAGAPANAVVYPDESQSFTIQPASDSNLCLEVESRTVGRGHLNFLIPRPCSPGSTAQQFSFDATTGHMHNASRPGECVAQEIVGYSLPFVMRSCTDRFAPTTFLPTPEDANIQAVSPTGDQKGKVCAWYQGEGKPVITQSCGGVYERMNFVIDPVSAGSS